MHEVRTTSIIIAMAHINEQSLSSGRGGGIVLPGRSDLAQGSTKSLPIQEVGSQ